MSFNKIDRFSSPGRTRRISYYVLLLSTLTIFISIYTHRTLARILHQHNSYIYIRTDIRGDK